MENILCAWYVVRRSTDIRKDYLNREVGTTGNSRSRARYCLRPSHSIVLMMVDRHNFVARVQDDNNFANRAIEPAFDLLT